MEGFASAWVAAWNGRDVEAVLAHFHEDAVFTSPIAERLAIAPDGAVRGKEALRRYWCEALARHQTLHFVLKDVFVGVNAIVIRYENEDGVERAEVLVFEEDLVVEGHGMFCVSAVR